MGAFLAALQAIPELVRLVAGLRSDVQVYAQALQDQRNRDFDNRLDALDQSIKGIKNAEQAQAMANALSDLQQHRGK